MKQIFTILIIIYAFLFGFGSLVGAISANKTVGINEKFGVRLTDIVSPMERVQSLA